MFKLGFQFEISECPRQQRRVTTTAVTRRERKFSLQPKVNLETHKKNHMSIASCGQRFHNNPAWSNASNYTTPPGSKQLEASGQSYWHTGVLLYSASSFNSWKPTFQPAGNEPAPALNPWP